MSNFCAVFLFFHDDSFLDIIQLADNLFVGGNFHRVDLFVQNVFLLDTSDEVADQIVENQRTREINHDKEHHDGHNFRHLARRNSVELGLVRLLTIRGFAHQLA